MFVGKFTGFKEFVSGRARRIRQSPIKIDVSPFDHERCFTLSNCDQTVLCLLDTLQGTIQRRSHMSKQAADHHKKAAEHHEYAAQDHKEAAKYHEAGNHEKAAHYAHLAHAHHLHIAHHSAEATKSHLEHHGKK